MIRDHDTIAAPATAAGGALAVIRISGEEALRICDRIFRGREPLAAAAGYTVHYGEIVDDGRVLDDVLVTVFRAPRSYTGEDAAEISCHGSQYIVSEILRLLTALQTTDREHVVTPANWQPGQPALVPPPRTYDELLSRQNNPQAQHLECEDWFLCSRQIPGEAKQ